MLDKCFNKISESVTGRPLTKTQIDMLRRDFSEELLAATKEGTPEAEIIQNALASFERKRQADVARRHANQIRNANALGRARSVLADAPDKIKALMDMASASIWDTPGRASMELMGDGLYRSQLPKLHQINEALGGSGWFENPENVRQFLKALYGETQGIDGKIVNAAKIWSDMAEDLRVRTNQAGGDIGKLKGWDVPHSWDEMLVSRVSKDQYVESMFPLLDRNAYLDEYGDFLTDDKVRSMLGDVYMTITTQGKWKMPEGVQIRGGGLKNRGTQERMLHFKDADSFFAAHSAYGRDALQVGMVRHVQNMTKNIAAMEYFGPDASANYQLLMKEAVAQNIAAGKKTTGEGLGLATFREYIGEHQDQYTGKTARFLQHMRNMQTTKLGGALISSFNDLGMMMLNGKVFGSSGADSIINAMKATGDKLEMQNAGIISEVMLHGMYKDAKHLMQVGKSRTVADTTLYYSGLSSWSRNNKTGFALALQNTFGHQVETAFDALPKAERKLLEGVGVTPDMWKVWGMADKKPSVNGAEKVLTTDSILDIPDSKIAAAFPGKDPVTIKRQAAETMAGTVQQMVNATLFEGSARQRAMMALGTDKGTAGGAIVRTLTQFKSFSMMYGDNLFRATRFMAGFGKGSAIGYAAGTVAMTTLLGGLSVQVKQLLAGRDPMAINEPRFLWKAFVQGGGASIFGDMLFQSETDFLKMLAGPTLSDFGKAIDISTRGMRAMQEGKDLTEKQGQDMGGDFIRLVRGYVPLTTLWYNRAIVDHVATNHAMEAVNPGYLRRMEDRTRKAYGQKTWWSSGDVIPDDAPDASALWRDR